MLELPVLPENHFGGDELASVLRDGRANCDSRPLPMTMDEARDRGWDELDVVFVSGDAYIDHPSFATAILGRVLEAAGYRVGIISQPDWQSCDD